MKRHLIVAAALMGVVALAGVAVSQEKTSLVSGPQVGKEVPGPFHPLNINGSSAGKKNCLYCEYGQAPVVMIFAREATPAVTQLIKKIDQCKFEGQKEDLCSCAIFLNDSEALTKDLQTLANKEGLKKLVLAIDNRQGPEDYKISKDADVTVLVYTDRNVRSNRAFRRGELTSQQIEQIIGDVRKMLTK